MTVYLSQIRTVLNEYDAANILYLRGLGEKNLTASEVVASALRYTHFFATGPFTVSERFNARTPRKGVISELFLEPETAEMIGHIRKTMKLGSHAEAISCALEFKVSVEQGWRKVAKLATMPSRPRGPKTDG